VIVKILLLSMIVLSKLNAQALPVVSMQMDPDQVARSLKGWKFCDAGWGLPGSRSAGVPRGGAGSRDGHFPPVGAVG
jgi:hypothetical protein